MKNSREKKYKHNLNSTLRRTRFAIARSHVPPSANTPPSVPWLTFARLLVSLTHCSNQNNSVGTGGSGSLGGSSYAAVAKLQMRRMREKHLCTDGVNCLLIGPTGGPQTVVAKLAPDKETLLVKRPRAP